MTRQIGMTDPRRTAETAPQRGTGLSKGIRRSDSLTAYPAILNRLVSCEKPLRL